MLHHKTPNQRAINYFNWFPQPGVFTKYNIVSNESVKYRIAHCLPFNFSQDFAKHLWLNPRIYFRYNNIFCIRYIKWKIYSYHNSNYASPQAKNATFYYIQ